jgi:Na+/H+ antiporter NhaC
MALARWLKKSTIPFVFCLLCFAALWRSQSVLSDAQWYSVLPPLIAVALSLLTHRILLSLATGVIVGGILSKAPFQPVSLPDWGHGLLESPRYLLSVVTDPVNLQILIFVACVLMMISILITAGGLLGIVNYLARFARGPRSTQFVTALMGLAIFIDDYANTMIVGSAMRPLTDNQKVSREKLAFLVDATSAPIAGIAVVSTWIGYEVGLFSDVSQSLQFGRDGYSMFFDALGYRFYCILMIVFVLANVISGRDFGAMAKAQRRSLGTGAISDPNAKPLTTSSFASAAPDHGARILARTAIIPIVGLFLVLLSALWIDGGGAAHGAGQIFNPGVWREVLGQSENSIAILMYAAIFSLIVAFITSLLVARLQVTTVSRALYQGFRGSLLPITILVLAWSLKTTCDSLQTGQFLVDAVGNVVTPLFLPCIVFLLAGLVAFATGTSWGTMAILIPTAIPIAHQLDGGTYGLTVMITLGAVLDGAILGDHCSPISDTTIMSSISSGCDHIHHVKTQIPYSITVGLIAVTCGYLPAAAGVPSWLGILIGGGLIIALFSFLRLKR